MRGNLKKFIITKQRVEYVLCVYEYKVFKRIFELRGKTVTGSWRKLLGEDFIISVFTEHYLVK